MEAIQPTLFERISQFIEYFNLTGVLIGLGTFLIIGIFHPFVIKGEYYFGVKIWWLFLLSGIVTLVASLAVRNILISTLLAVWGASSLWGIGELFEQRERVRKGWFPKRNV
ncbi:hypothetical protein M9Y10_034739 [Tritrichomonas musculus]|uniref:DUF4491 domain-containing protein n=1 Tax=Tritrichomonas musculus TaxID=1915356 RepID=A0ABR2KHT2_9EUKA